MVAAAVIGAGVLGAGATAFAGSQASGAQQQASQNATNAQLQMFRLAQQALAPYRTFGAQNMGAYQNALFGYGNLMGIGQNGQFNSAQIQQFLNNLPGYQFTLNQGLKSVQNSYAARGLGSSGAAMRGAAEFATGLANQNYANYLGQYGNYVGNLQNAVGLGENAAAGTGTAAIQTGQNVGSNMLYGGNAAAAGWNAIGAGVNNAAGQIGNLYMTNALMQGMGYPGVFGSSGAYGGVPLVESTGMG